MLRLSAAACLLFPTASALAQVVEQTIQISPGPGVGPMQFPGVGGPRQTRTGSGRIRGRVLASDGAGPIRRAQVRISGNDIAPKVALTDADGRYDFRDLPSGRFTLQATKSGFVTTQFGQTRPFESGRPIELAEKQQLDNADVNMPRGGVISGRIVDEFGDAIPDVAVTAMRQTWSNGRRRLTASPGRIAPTNDLGQYRIYGLPPGDYYVTATLRGGAALDMVEMELMIAASTTSSAGPTASSPRSGYASTYFPGTANAAEAQKISLAPGQEMASADFGLIAVRLARITGLVLGSDGKPLEGAAVSAMPAGGREGALLGTNNTRTGRDGTFTLNNVPPGDYTLQARSIQVITSTQGDNLMVFRAASMVGGGESEFGSMPLSVGGEDLSNVLIATGKGATATGQVTFDGPRPASITSIRVTSLAADGDAAPGGGFGVGSVKEDGTFELKGLSGTRLIRVNAPPGWTLKSVKLNGADITDSGAEFKPGEPVSGLEVELTQRVSSIAGSVTSSDGSMLKDYTVVVFAENPDLWRLPMTRWVTGTRPDQDGRFKVQNMPAGNYLAVAVDYIPQGEWGDPEVLDRLKSKARRFTLDHGAIQTLDLKLTGDY